MPYFYDPLMDKDKENAQGLQLSSASQSMDPAAKPGDTVAGATPSGGSRFQNLDSYLKNNNAQAAGQQLGDKVRGDVEQAKSAMDSTANQFKTQVENSGTVASQDQIDKAIADPTKADADQFKGWTNASYSGPKGLAENQNAWNQYWGAAANANTTAKQAGTESGRFALLDKYFGRPAYSFGEKSLDNLLVQRGGGLKDAKALQDQAAGLNAYGNQQTQGLASSAADRSAKVDQTRKAARSAVGIDDKGQVLTGDNAGAIGKAWDQVNQEVSSTNAARSQETEGMRKALQSGVLTPDQAKALGLNGHETIYGLDPSSYLTAGQDLTKDQVMTPDERAKIKALSTLAGVDDTFASGAASDPSSAYSFDLNRFKNAVNTAGSNYLTDVGNSFQQIKDSAPLSADYLNSLTAQSNPADVLGKLRAEYASWEQAGKNGNPYAESRMSALSQGINSLAGVMARYGIDQNTGLARSLSDKFTVKKPSLQR